MKKEKTLKLNLSSVLAMITVLLTFFISAAIAKQMTSANVASDTDWNPTTTSWTQEYEYTTVPHSYTVPYSYTESDTSYTRWETENNGSTTSNYSDETSSQTSWSQENSSTSRVDSLNQLAISDLLDILKASESQEVRELAVEIENEIENIEPEQAIEDIVAALNDSTLNLTEIEEDTLEVLKRKISSFIVVGPAVGPADYTYEVYDGKVTITGANLGTSSSITIPSTLGGYPVTEIGDSAFSNCTNLTSITIPDSVTSIGYRAFYGCCNLSSITISDSVTSIGGEAFLDTAYYEGLNWENGVLYISNHLIKADNSGSYVIKDGTKTIADDAFDWCEGLTSVTIPDSVTSIGRYAFSGCTSLESITVDSNNKNYLSDEYGVLFNKDKTELIQYPIGNSRTSYTVPDSVTSIDGYAFAWCESLVSVTFGESSRLTSIDNWAFYYCTSLESITIPNSVTSVGYEVFDDTAYYNNESNWENGVLYIGKHLIKAKDTVSGSYAIKDGTKTIADNAFDWCEGLTSVTIPDSVTSIGRCAFGDCRSISSVTFGENSQLTSIDDDVFYYCTNLESITIPDSVTSIGDYAFGGCESLASITIPGSVTSIGEDAFYGCTSLEDIYYSGTDEEWNEIISDEIRNVKIHFGNEAPTEPTTKPTKTAVRLEINSPSTKSINYGDSVVLHADIEWMHPDGAKIIKVVWSADNGNFSYSVSPDGLSCTISPESSGETAFTATVYDMDGNEISSDTVQMTAKASIWHKIIAFFKKLLSLNEIIPYAMKNLYKK